MIRALALCIFIAAPAMAQDSGSAARDAARAVEAASLRLQEAASARDRVAALTETVQAYEDGLAAMRDGLRRAAIRERELALKLQSQEKEIAELLGVLTALGGRVTPKTYLHPQGALGMARSGMMLAAIAPGLSAEAQALRRDLDEVSNLRQLQQNAAASLAEGLAGIQEARTRLSQAIADRTDLPRRFTEDPVRTAILISATETLDAFASGLSQITEGEIAENLARIDDRRGSLALPARGVLLRQSGEQDAAGVARPGIILATRPSALVTSPTAATLRYVGPLLDYGLVSILEPQSDLLIVIAGMDQVYGEAGQVIPEGSPLGLMGGNEGQTGDFTSPSSESTGAERSETLYIEIREGGAPVDPLMWFATDKG